mmetsp:Transcript_10131/g.24584  ORF Transcript_10131/g.24584 Transcript_10131/m.24584 type:complete len:617 (+) Transcript_10131:300-2150(+)|eukprot:CAMPEP_0197175530 /NCGR_PEP_ID=MMETSP1423-20130617/1726_1 /TAXON_ID=476441 /ORGANISM="Pseudo-nitzschia heimii, Strain UNC1101" /LENGTH=616 /DNA_ID=CAMNT_0042624709 /DNA_START=231 /DNA_END=2081 /DNA_ORIENTATION=+
MGKGLKLKKRFRKKPLTFGGSSKDKDRSTTTAETDENNDFEYSEDVQSDGSEDNNDEFFHRQSINRFGLERTWSVNALQISTHSTGNVYVESDSDSDASSSYESFGSDGSDDDGNMYTDDDDDDVDFDDEADHSRARVTNEVEEMKTPKQKKKGSVNLKSPLSNLRSPMEKYKKKVKKRNFGPEAIPEGDEDDEFEDVTESESDENSAQGYETPATLTKSLTTDKFSSGHPGISESGYSSDSALVRKRMAMIQKEQDAARKKHDSERAANEGKKKNGGKKKQPLKKKEKKKVNKSDTNLDSTHSGGLSLEGDSTVTSKSAESDEEGRQSSERKAEKNGKKKKKKKKKKNGKGGKDGKGGKKKKKRVISFVVDGDDASCADFDKRLDEIEQFEAALVEERKLIQKERETMAFERESMEMRLDEETHHCDELNSRIRELEQKLQSQKLSNLGDAESNDEKQSLKSDFAREKREFRAKLFEKEREISKLNLALRDMKLSHGSTGNGKDSSFDSKNCDGKSRERLQGELLQAVAKVSEKEAQLKSQGIELKLTRDQLASMKRGGGNSELKMLLNASQEERRRLQQELEFERNDNVTKLKEKDETVSYLMTELARLKQARR